MPTYPQVSDSMAALSRADGTTVAHHIDHGRVIGFPENVMFYGARPDATKAGATAGTAPDSSVAVQAAIDAVYAAGGGGVYIPPGGYYFANTVVLKANVHVQGAGGLTQATRIWTTDKYAFTSVAFAGSFSLGGIWWETAAPGAAAAGAVKLLQANSVHLRDISANSWVNQTVPGIWLNGAIEVTLEDCVVGSCGTHGIQIDNGGWFANLNHLIRCRGTSTVAGSAAVYCAFTRRLLIRDCHFESNRGYGVWLRGGDNNIVESCWFEDNSNHNVLIDDDGVSAGLGHKLLYNEFFYNHGDIGTADHVNVALTGATNHHVLVTDNNFADNSSSTVSVRIGATTTHTSVLHNRGSASLTDGSIVDGGLFSYIEGNGGSNVASDRVQLPGDKIRRFGKSSASTNWTELIGDANANALLSHYVGASSTSFPRLILATDISVDGGGGVTGLALGKKTDTTNIFLHGGVVYGSTDALGLAAADGASMKTMAFVNATSGTFATTANATKLGFRGSTPVVKETVTGAKGGNAALTDLLAKLVNLGLIADGTT